MLFYLQESLSGYHPVWRVLYAHNTNNTHNQGDMWLITMVIIKFVWRMQLSINDVTVAKIITTLWEGIVVFVVSNLFNKVCYGVRWWIRNFIKHPVCYHWNKVADKSLYSRSVNLEYNSYTNKNTWSFRNLFQSDSLCCIDLEAKKKVCTPALFYACQRGRSWKGCCPENSNKYNKKHKLGC